MIASIANVHESRGSKVIAYVCHVRRQSIDLRVVYLANNRTTMGFNPDLRDQGNFLLLESSTGEGELVGSKNLKKLIASHLPDLDLVFVAACDSDFVGKIF